MSSAKVSHAHDHATKLTKPTGKYSRDNGAIKKVIDKRGGHGLWGKPSVSDGAAPSALNELDPNFDEYEGKAVLEESHATNGNGRAPEVVLADLLIEYIESGDAAEAVADLKEHPLIEPADFVAAAVVYGLEHHAYERELISQLISETHPIFEGKGIDEGFQRILSKLPDLALDTPDAAEYVGQFVARAIYDDTLAPAFIKNAVVDNEPAKLALNLAYNVVHEPSERSRLENIWGPSALTSVDKLRDEVSVIIKEYMVSLDIAEADRALLALNAPSFMSQVVKQAIYAAIEGGNHKPRDLVLKLLSSWADAAIIPEFHIRRGFELAQKGLDEIKLDVPHS